MRKFIFRWALGVVTHADLSIEEMNLFTEVLLRRLGALPIHGIITSSDEGLLISGELLDTERAQMLREYAQAALQNKALNLIVDQTRFVAFRNGLATGLPPNELIFFRAALWVHEQIKNHLRLLAQESPELTG